MEESPTSSLNIYKNKMMEKEENKNYVSYQDVLLKLRYGIDAGITAKETCEHFNVYEGYFYDYLRRQGKKALIAGSISQDEYDKLSQLYETLKKNLSPERECISENKDGDEQLNGIKVRDENGKIKHYECNVSDRDGNDTKVIISREIMDKIHTLYATEGCNISQRAVSRELLLELDVDFYAFQKILRAFGITKSSIPFAPHILEEADVNTTIERTFRQKEKMLFKKLEYGRYKKIEARNIQLFEENTNLKNRLSNLKDILNGVDLSKVEPFVIDETIVGNEKALVVYLADCHFGALVDNNEALYENDYSIKEVSRRFSVIVQHIYKLTKTYGVFDKIILVNMGDLLDGDKNSTSRGGHFLPQYLNGRQQFNLAVNVLKQFIHVLYENKLAKTIDWYSVPCGNHDGTLGYAAAKLIEEYCRAKYNGMTCFTFEKFIDYITWGKHILIFSHGKDAIDLGKHYGLTLNDNLENRINEYLDFALGDKANGMNILFTKADLHESATTYTKRFKYRSVGSIFGSSLYIQLNFGDSVPVCEYSILDKEDKNDVVDGRIILR
jgi:hypothetical protein